MTSVRALVLRDLFAGHPARTAIAIAGSAAAVACDVAVPGALAHAVSGISAHGSAAGPVALVGALLAGGLLAAVISSQANARRGAGTTALHRTAVLEHILRLPVYQRRFAPGELLTRFISDTRAPAQVGTATINALINVGGGVAALVALWLIDWRLGALMVVEMAVSWLAVRAFLRRIGTAETGYRTAWGRLGMLLADAYQGVRTIRASGTRDREVRRILAPLTELRTAGRASLRSQQVVVWQMGLMAPVREIGVLVIAGLGVAAGRLTGGQVLAALGYSLLALNILNQVDTLQAVAQYANNCQRLLDVLHAPTLDTTPTPRHLPPAGRGEIRFYEVSLTNDTDLVLDRVSFTVPAGAHVAIVGRSGTGKSMLVALPARLADAESGTVSVDGVDVRQVDLTHLRGEFAYAFEEPLLFGATIGESIAATTPVNQASVTRAARMARAEEFILRLPHGYATPVDQAPMSGGELQRVGLARALARPARVLVIDDAMSSLDTATAAEVSHAIRSAWQNRTALMIAHRATTAASADLVAWLDGGRLRALAPHGQLWQDAEYRAVFGIEKARS